MVVDWLYLVFPFFVCVFFSSRGSLTRGCVQGTDWEVSNSKKKGSPPSIVGTVLHTLPSFFIGTPAAALSVAASALLALCYDE